MEKVVIDLCEIKKKYGNQNVLNNLTLKVKKNDFLVIMGDSGSGKSTLINILCLLDIPDSGKYFLLENNTSEMTLKQKNELRRNEFNIIFQKYNLFEELTIYENLITYLDICGLNKENAHSKIIEMAEVLNIKEHLHKKVSILSHGEKQRVAIARSFLTDKNIIVADEPTASVDKNNRDIIIKQLQEAHFKGKTVIVVTHDAEYLKVATRKLSMSFGELKEITK